MRLRFFKAIRMLLAAAALALLAATCMPVAGVYSPDRTMEQPWGERRLVRDRHNELLTRFLSTDGHDDFAVRVRVFDDGGGFRYEFGGEGEVAILAERTGFNIAGPGTAWWQPADGKVRCEHLYRETALEAVEKAHTPWRTVQIADDAKGLVNSSLILNLNEPNALGDVPTDWEDSVALAGEIGEYVVIARKQRSGIPSPMRTRSAARESRPNPRLS